MVRLVLFGNYHPAATIAVFSSDVFGLRRSPPVIVSLFVTPLEMNTSTLPPRRNFPGLHVWFDINGIFEGIAAYILCSTREDGLRSSSRLWRPVNDHQATEVYDDFLYVRRLMHVRRPLWVLYFNWPKKRLLAQMFTSLLWGIYLGISNVKDCIVDGDSKNIFLVLDNISLQYVPGSGLSFTIYLQAKLQLGYWE